MSSLDIKELLQFLRKRWWAITVSAVICTVVAALVTIYLITPMYKANSTLYVYKNMASTDTNDVSYNDLLANTQLVKDYRELVKSRQVASAVISELGLTGVTTDDISKKLSVTNKNETRIIQITATDKDPEQAAKIANTVAKVFQEKAVSIMQVNNVQIIDNATVPKNPYKPNLLLNLILGFILGAIVSCGILILVNYFDDTIKTPEDVQKYISVPVIGTIPVFPEK